MSHPYNDDCAAGDECCVEGRLYRDRREAAMVRAAPDRWSGWFEDAAECEACEKRGAISEAQLDVEAQAQYGTDLLDFEPRGQR
jgi:hypothetical protein